MANRDTDADEEYDFLESEGGVDGPYAAAGGPIMASASVTVEGDDTDGMDDGDSMDGEDGSNEMSDQDGDGEMAEESGDSVPGFGITAALVALLAAAAIARRVD